MKLLHNYILIEKVKPKQPESGLIIPNKAQDENIGEVLEVGMKVKHIEKGEKLKYQRHCGHPWHYEGKDCLVIREDDVICTL